MEPKTTPLRLSCLVIVAVVSAAGASAAPRSHYTVRPERVPGLGYVEDVAFADHGRKLVTLSGDTLTTWDPARRVKLDATTFAPKLDPNIVLSPDGTRLAADTGIGLELGA